jgi:hypothetical protein
MSRKLLLVSAMLIAGSLIAASAVRAEEEKEKAPDWKSLQSAKVTLEKGLAAAARNGKPISGKFEMDEGKLQLSIYIEKDGKFSEVIVDHATGAVKNAEKIDEDEAEDLAAATAQGQAMAKAKKSLASVVESAVAANNGYRALSAVPEVKGGRPVATIVLVNASGKKTVSEGLD